VKECLFLGGLSFVRVRSLGEQFILLSSESSNSLEKLIEENKEWLDGFFNSLFLWSESFVGTEKLA